jgi:hypothetical protein
MRIMRYLGGIVNGKQVVSIHTAAVSQAAVFLCRMNSTALYRMVLMP